MNIAWVIVVLLLVIFFQGVLYSKYGLRGISYKRWFHQQAVFAGEEIEMIDEISNKKLLPLPWLRMEVKMSPYLIREGETKEEEETFHRTLFSFKPYQKITRKHRLIGRKRGYYPLQTVAVTTGDGIGFSEVFDSFEAAAAVTVYPELVSLDELPLPSHSWLGDITVKRWIIEDPFLQAGIKEYQPGDSLQSINWNATARTQTLQVNKKDYTADHHLLIYVNFDTNEDIRLPVEHPETVEKMLSYAASLAQYTLNNGIATGFGCNGYFVEPFTNSVDRVKPSVRVAASNSGQQWEYLLDVLAKVKINRSRNFRAFLQEDVMSELSGHDILIFTIRLSDKVRQQIAALEQLGNAVEVVEVGLEGEETDGA